MVKSIHIKNFQSHENTKLILDKNVRLELILDGY